jgi:hypothetical protein
MLLVHSTSMHLSPSRSYFAGYLHVICYLDFENGGLALDAIKDAGVVDRNVLLRNGLDDLL